MAWRVGDPSRAPALAGAQPRGDRLDALELVWGGRRCEPDSRAVGDGRATGMERSAEVEPKGRRRRRVGDQPRRPQPRSRSETARFSARRDPRRQGRRALRPPTGRSRRTVGGTVARSGMEGGRAAPSAGELSRTWRRSALAAFAKGAERPQALRVATNGSGRRRTARRVVGGSGEVAGGADRQANGVSAGVVRRRGRRGAS